MDVKKHLFTVNELMNNLGLFLCPRLNLLFHFILNLFVLRLVSVQVFIITVIDVLFILSNSIVFFVPKNKAEKE